MKEKFSSDLIRSKYTLREVSIFGVFLVRIFPHSKYLSVFSLNGGKDAPENCPFSRKVIKLLVNFESVIIAAKPQMYKYH